MEYTKLLSRALNIVLNHKFLVVLGAIAALGSGSPGSQISWQTSGGEGSNSGSPSLEGAVASLPQFNEEMFSYWSIPLIIVGIAILIAIGVAIWVASIVARGGLIAGVDTIEENKLTSFAEAWKAGIQRLKPLVAIGLTPVVPVLVFFGILVIAAGMFGGPSAIIAGEIGGPLIAGISVVVLLAACITLPLTVGLSLMRVFAERACVVEGLGPYFAYRRGWDVVTTHIGDAILLFILQIVITIGLVAALFVPGIIMALCFLTWPILLLGLGAIDAYFSTMWTLAWREWTGVGALHTFDDPFEADAGNLAPQGM